MSGKHAFRAATRAMKVEQSRRELSNKGQMDLVKSENKRLLMAAALNEVERCPVHRRVRTKAVLYAYLLGFRDTVSLPLPREIMV